MSSIFDEDGLIRESYALARSHLAYYGAQGGQYACWETIAATFALYFFAQNVMFGDRGVVVNTKKELDQYACAPLLSRGLRLFFPTPKVESIICTESSLQRLSPSICGLKRIRSINLRGNEITRLPEALVELLNLEELDVSSNAITCLPSQLHRLTKLRRLNAMNNRIEEVPVLPSSLVILGLKGNRIKAIAEAVFERATALEQLYLTANNLVALPTSIAKCKNLRKLQLSHNELTALPTALADLKHLELLRLACNQLEELPEALLRSPALTWMSLQGNPMTNSRFKLVVNSIRIIDEKDVEVGRLLGAGASGQVFEATYRKDRVAFKVFLDEKSPDGDWQDEIKLACMFNHEGLARVIARVRDEQKNVRGLVMEYQDGKPLADRPTQSQLLRCLWEPGRVFDIRFVINCLTSVCSALEHLHSRCVAHGDVYAHNVLAREDGMSILCDYGAAFVYRKGDVLYEKHEIRAFGLLVRGLIERVDISFADMDVALYCQKQLLVMAQRCLSVDVEGRPKFKELSLNIKKLQKACCT